MSLHRLDYIKGLSINYNHGQKSGDKSVFVGLLLNHTCPTSPKLPNNVGRLYPGFPRSFNIAQGWGGGGGGGGGGGRTARYFFPKVGTQKLQMVITNIITACASPSQRFFSQDYNSNEIRVFKEPHGHSSPERSTPAYGQNYTVQDNKGWGGGGAVLVSFVSQL